MRPHRFAFAWLLLSAVAHANDAERPDAPHEEAFLGEPAFTQDRGQLQAVARFEQTHIEDEDIFSAIVELEIGITDEFQVEADVPTALRFGDGTSSVTNPDIGVLWNFHATRDPDSVMSLGAAVELPSFGNDLGDDAWIFVTRLVAYRKLGPIGANLSFGPLLERRLEEDAPREVVPGTAAILSLVLDVEPVRPLVELGSELTDEHEWSGALGVLIDPAEDWEIGVGGLGLVQSGELGYGAALYVTHELRVAGQSML